MATEARKMRKTRGISKPFVFVELWDYRPPWAIAARPDEDDTEQVSRR